MEFLKIETVMEMETDRNRPSTIRIIAGIIVLFADFRYLGFVVMECGALQIGLMRSYGFLSMYGVSY